MPCYVYKSRKVQRKAKHDAKHRCEGLAQCTAKQNYRYFAEWQQCVRC